MTPSNAQSKGFSYVFHVLGAWPPVIGGRRAVSRKDRGMTGKVRVDHRLYLVGHKCPMNFVYTKLKLEEMHDGENLEVIVSAGEPARNVPRSIAAEGHLVLEEEPCEEDYRLLIQKVGE